MPPPIVRAGDFGLGYRPLRDEDLPFDVDPFSKLMLLEGTDELGYLLGKAPSARFLAQNESPEPVITSTCASLS